MSDVEETEGPALEPPPAEELAALFHQTYALLAVRYGFQIMPDQQVGFEQLPDGLRRLLTRTCEIVRDHTLARATGTVAAPPDLPD